MSSVTEERRKDEGVTRNVGSQDERFDAAQSGAAADDDQTPPKEMDPQAVSPRQRLALEAFCKGGTIGDAAKAADVSRQTLHRWRAKYPHFALAMSSWSSACVAIAESQLEELASRAVCALAIAIDKGDARSAMAVLRSLGILRTYQPSKAPPAGAEKPLALPGMDFLAQALAGAPQEELNPGAPGSSEQEKEAVANCGGAAAKQGVPDFPGSSVAVVTDAGRPPKTGFGAPGDKVETSRPGNSSTAKNNGVTETRRTVCQPAGVLRHQNVTSQPGKTQKAAILARKVGSAIKRACDNGLQDATECYQMLPTGPGQNASPPRVSFASCA